MGLWSEGVGVSEELRTLLTLVVLERLEPCESGSACEELVGELGFVVVVLVGVLVVVTGFVESEHLGGCLLGR